MASDKSGVLVTQDIDTGDRTIVSVAVNEGLGGAVDGQAAESLRIPLDGSPVRVLATATDPAGPWTRRNLPLISPGALGSWVRQRSSTFLCCLFFVGAFRCGFPA